VFWENNFSAFLAVVSRKAIGPMIIKTVQVSNFRCIRDAMLNLDPLTVLIGPNGSGKSCLLKAIDMFYTPSARYDETDFYDNSKDITITLSFGDLRSDEKEFFKKYVEGNSLTVEKVMSWPTSKTSQKYHGMSLRNPNFEAFRKAKGQALRDEYQKLLETYADLPAYSNKDDAETALSQWEANNLQQCSRVRDDGQFWGFKEVGEAHLEKYTRFIPIPAVKDATEDAVEGKSSATSEIIDLVIRNELAQKKEFVEFQQETVNRYRGVLPDLGDLSNRLTEAIQGFVPESKINLKWTDVEDLALPSPRAETKLLEDGYFSPVDKTGHGLQRAYILTMLQQLSLTQAATTGPISSDAIVEKTAAAPCLIISVEEPELYQHPDRQRHFSKALLQLSVRKLAGVAERIQVIYSTHSPLFVDLDRFEQLRIFRKVPGSEGKPRHATVTCTTLEDIARNAEAIRGKSEGTYSKESLKPHLQVLLTPWFNEGFFSRLVVLVEGVTDRGAVLGVASSLGHDLESRGVSVIPYNSKSSLLYALLIFHSLGIPVYGIWDGDSNLQGDSNNAKCNRTLLRSFNESEEDCPETVTDRFAVFKTDLLETFRAEVGSQLFDRLLQEYLRRLELRDVKKLMGNPSIVRDFYGEIGKSGGSSSKTMENIVSNIVARLG